MYQSTFRKLLTSLYNPQNHLPYFLQCFQYLPGNVFTNTGRTAPNSQEPISALDSFHTYGA